MSERPPAAHPGEVLARDFLQARSLSQYRLATDIGVPPIRINEIVHGKRGISADTALRLALYFGNEPGFWMRLQADWELRRARERLGSRLREEVRCSAPAPGPGPGPGPAPTRSAPGPRPGATAAEAPRGDLPLEDHLL